MNCRRKSNKFLSHIGDRRSGIMMGLGVFDRLMDLASQPIMGMRENSCILSLNLLFGLN
jgi:hypothetical protein